MKSKLIFRILGALASALIIVSVFVPFISVTGYSQSLWQAHSSVGTLYLPIMIIVFGAIGVIFFSINIKTELAYTSSGALIFYLITQTIPIINQGAFKTLSVGYYCLAVGTLLTGLMAFLCNLKRKVKVEKSKEQETKEISMIEQIDKLYNDQSSITNVSENNNLIDIIQPLPVDVAMPNIPVSTDNNSNVMVENVSNPVVPEFTQPVENVSNPVVPEFTQPVENVSNPVVSEFTQPVENVSNPVVSEFNISQNNSQFIQNQVTQTTNEPQTSENVTDYVEPIQPISLDKKADVMAEQSNNSSSNLDIFG